MVLKYEIQFLQMRLSPDALATHNHISKCLGVTHNVTDNDNIKSRITEVRQSS